MDDLLLQYMNASDEPTANEKAAALSQALRRKQDLGTLATLSGGALASPGAALLGAAGNEGQALMHAQVARTARLDRQAQQDAQTMQHLKELADKKREQEIDNARADKSLAITEKGQALQAQGNALMQQLAVQAAGRQAQDSANAEAARTRLGATELGTLAELPVAERQVDEAVDAFNRLNMGGIAGKAGAAATNLLGLQGTDAAEYNAKALQAMQAAGKIMEGGKLAAGDEAKYRRMLPQPGDSEAVVQQKATGLKSFLRELATRRATALKQAGYNVPESVTPQASAPANDEHAQALQWARAHPNDPRAKKILQLNGAK